MRPTANVMCTLTHHSEAPWNESQFKNARYDQLLVDSRAERDPAKRQEMHCELQRMMRDNDGTLIPCHINYVDAVNKKVKGLGAVPLCNTSGAEWPEFAWIDA